MAKTSQPLQTTPSEWNDYQLVDSGNGEKLERFGAVTLIRPEPSANWPKSLSGEEWHQKHDARFVARSNTQGEWVKKSKNKPSEWHINYHVGQVNIKLRLALTKFKHIGIFPEQAANWQYIASSLIKFKNPAPKVLNLFAYTGGASIAAKACGADVTHVDSIKQVVTWANQNQELSGLRDIRWVVEDAFKFVKREMKRGNLYNGIILDPPAYGHGPKGERWKLENQIEEMIEQVSGLLDPKEHFLVLNTYTPGFNTEDIERVIKTHNPRIRNLETGDLYLQSSTKRKLIMSNYGRFRKLL